MFIALGICLLVGVVLATAVVVVVAENYINVRINK